MDLKSLLSEAKAAKTQHDREIEIANVDLTPEEYMLLREDDQHDGLSLLQAICEKLENSGWVVDSNTRRLCKRSVSSARPNQYSLALTSNSRQFFLKVYRDYDEFPDDIFAKCATLTEAVTKTDDHYREARIKKVQRDLDQYLEDYKKLQPICNELNKKWEFLVDYYNSETAAIGAKAEELRATLEERVNRFSEERVFIDKQVVFHGSDGEDSPHGSNAVRRPDGNIYAWVDNLPCRIEAAEVVVSEPTSWIFKASGTVSLCARDLLYFLPKLECWKNAPRVVFEVAPVDTSGVTHVLESLRNGRGQSVSPDYQLSRVKEQTVKIVPKYEGLDYPETSGYEIGCGLLDSIMPELSIRVSYPVYGEAVNRSGVDDFRALVDSLTKDRIDSFLLNQQQYAFAVYSQGKQLTSVYQKDIDVTNPDYRAKVVGWLDQLNTDIEAIRWHLAGS